MGACTASIEHRLGPTVCIGTYLPSDSWALFYPYMLWYKCHILDLNVVRGWSLLLLGDSGLLGIIHHHARFQMWLREVALKHNRHGGGAHRLLVPCGGQVWIACRMAGRLLLYGSLLAANTTWFMIRVKVHSDHLVIIWVNWIGWRAWLR